MFGAAPFIGPGSGHFPTSPLPRQPPRAGSAAPEVPRRKRKRRHEAAHPQPAELARAGAAARGRLPPAHRGRRGSGPPGSVQRRLRVPPGAAAALGRAAGGGGEPGAPLGAAPRTPPQLRGRRAIPAAPPPRPARGGGAGGGAAVPGLGATLPHLQGGPQHAPDRGRGLKTPRFIPKIRLSPLPQKKDFWECGKSRIPAEKPQIPTEKPKFPRFYPKNGAQIPPHVTAGGVT